MRTSVKRTSWSAGVALALLAALALTLLGAAPAAAVDITSCPFVINSPDVYNVRANLTATGDCIIVNPGASSIINLNGFTLTGPNTGAGVGIDLQGASGIINGSGTVRRFGIGIRMTGGGGSQVQGVIVTESRGAVPPGGGELPHTGVGIQLIGSDGNLITGSTSTANEFIGVQLQNSNGNQVANNMLTNNGKNFFGIGLLAGLLGTPGAASSSSNLIANNNINDNAGNGVRFERGSNSNALLSNNVNNNGGDSVHISSGNNPIQDNTVNNNGNGISLESSAADNVIQGNTVNNNRSAIFNYYLGDQVTEMD